MCARLLREYASVFGRTERYTIYDQADIRRVIDWLLSDADRGRIQRALADYGQPASAEVLAEISRGKDRLLSPEGYERSAAHPGAPLIAELWRESESELQRCNAFESDDLLAVAVRLLGEQPHRRAWLRQRWRRLLADEFEDTSHAQATLVDLLAGLDGNLASAATTGSRARKPNSWDSSRARSSCFPLGGGWPRRIPNGSPKSAGCSTSPPPARRTGC